jgi:ankyrin repeat protein
MYPNPQDVLPLPPSPNLAQYRKRAKELLKAAQSGDPSALRIWTSRWVENLVALYGDGAAGPDRRGIDRYISEIETFARGRMEGAAGPTLAQAQFVIARAHGFASWPAFARHLESLALPASPVSAFESAADAVVSGDAATLARLLREHPGLVRARSTREHRATLLHYVAANGVENYRQKSPANAAAIARMLLDAGADVDASADVYGGGSTTLGLVATITPPAIAGVQLGVIDVLLEHGARMDREGSAGSRHALVRGCLANGQANAARYLASRGAPLDVIGAAGIGRLDVVGTFFDASGSPRSSVHDEDLREAMAFACSYGHPDVAAFLLAHGVDANAELRLYGQGHTALHLAAYHAHVEILDLLIAKGAALDVVDKTWGTPPLVWALTGWQDKAAATPELYYRTVGLLVAAGACVAAEWLDDPKVRTDGKMLDALRRSS